MKVKKRVISGVLAAFMLASVIPTSIVHARELNAEDNYKTEIKEYTEDITLDDGSIVDVDIVEETQIPIQTGIAPRSFSPKVKVGTRKTFKVRISNASLGFPNVLKGGISHAKKKKFIKAASKAIAKKLGASFLPGVNFATWLLSAVGAANALSGSKGFEIGSKMEYRKTYLHKEGFYMYGWRPLNAYIKGYK